MFRSVSPQNTKKRYLKSPRLKNTPVSFRSVFDSSIS